MQCIGHLAIELVRHGIRWSKVGNALTVEGAVSQDAFGKFGLSVAPAAVGDVESPGSGEYVLL